MCKLRMCPITGRPLPPADGRGRPPEYATPEAQRLAKALRRTTAAVAGIHGIGMTEGARRNLKARLWQLANALNDATIVEGGTE